MKDEDKRIYREVRCETCKCTIPVVIKYEYKGWRLKAQCPSCFETELFIRSRMKA